MYIVIAIIAFGLLIAVHELGHFTAAKLLGVRVNEFAIGMGPKILSKQGKETFYSLRLLPIGGFCAMEGEDGGSDDPHSFIVQKRWRRVVILAAGGLANLLTAFILILIVVAGVQMFVGTTLTDVMDGSPLEGQDGLLAGDRIVSINGERLYYVDDFHYLTQLAGNRETADLVIERDGERISLDGFPLVPREYIIDGEPRMMYGLTFNRIEPNLIERLKYSVYTAANNVRLIRLSIAQLISGAAGVQDLAGPVAIVGAMNDIGNLSPTFGAALRNIAEFTAFIGINIAFVNFLPIPAMDGGRILFVFITWIIEKIARRKVDPKYEGYIHTGALVLLMGFMVFVLFNDVMRMVNG